MLRLAIPIVLVSVVATAAGACTEAGTPNAKDGAVQRPDASQSEPDASGVDRQTTPQAGSGGTGAAEATEATTDAGAPDTLGMPSGGSTAQATDGGDATDPDGGMMDAAVSVTPPTAGHAGGAAGTAGSSAGAGGTTVSEAGSSGTAGVGGAGGAAGMAGSGAASPNASDELFDPDRVPRFDVTLSGDAIAALGDVPDVYVQGTLKYGSVTLQNVGVRIKGESSRRTLSQKAALKIKLDEFVQNQTLLGLKRITLNNMVADPSFIAERLAYHMYRAAGLPAPRCNSALLYVNGDFYGVYANVESEDKAFIRRWFSDDDGNLYEDGQVDLRPGNEMYFDLETNEAANDRSDLTALIAAIASANPDTYPADLDATLDTEHFLRFTALEGLVDQWDMYGYTFFEPNNFRIYHDPVTSKFTFIPWGMDMALKPLPYTMRPHIGMFQVSPYEDQPGARDAGGLIFVRCLQSANCKAHYATVLRDMLSKWEAEKLDTLAEKYYAQIKDYVYQDTRKELTNDAFEAGYQSLLTTIRSRAAAVRADLEQAGL